MLLGDSKQVWNGPTVVHTFAENPTMLEPDCHAYVQKVKCDFFQILKALKIYYELYEKFVNTKVRLDSLNLTFAHVKKDTC